MEKRERPDAVTKGGRVRGNFGVSKFLFLGEQNGRRTRTGRMRKKEREREREREKSRKGGEKVFVGANQITSCRLRPTNFSPEGQ
jgi:general stress protein YciG